MDKRVRVAFLAIIVFLLMGGRPITAAPQAFDAPASDPVVANPPRLIVTAAHPRVLFTAEEIPAMRAFARGPGKMWFDEIQEYVGSCRPPKSADFLRNATAGQRVGFWRMPTVALHYVLTGEKKSFKNARGYLELLLSLEHWELGKELDSGMSAGNILCGAALTFDWLYNDLEPEFRERFRRKLILQARRMYYLGHKMGGAKRAMYWQGDPANNHRWHRNAGFVPAVLAAYSGAPEENWILQKAYDDVAFVAKWLPDDGTCHESSSYMIFGGNHLMVAMDAADHCFGTSYLDLPYFKNHAGFRLQVMRPGLTDAFHYGDSGGVGVYGNYLFECAGRNGQADEQAALLEMFQKNPKTCMFAWFSLLWHNPAVTGGAAANLPTASFYPDLGLAFMRDGWKADNVGVMFKCGPNGGYKLNEYRESIGMRNINVAHNDPDANSFTIHVGGHLVAETSRYSKNKLSSSHNTILVNGAGQRNEGGVWMQPYSGKGDQRDMTNAAVVTAYKDAGDVVIVEGEAAGAYPAIKAAKKRRGKAKIGRPALQRYRRTMVWVKGGYLLVLDDIRAEQQADITWLMQGPEVKAIDAEAGRYQLSKDGAVCDFQVIADRRFGRKIGVSTADGRGKSLGWKQLQLTANTDAWRLVSVYNPWGHAPLDVKVDAKGPNAATVTVTGPGFADTWQWEATPGQWAPSKIAGTRPDGFAVTMDASDAAWRP